MKKEYQKPIIEIEVYQMDAAIAVSCSFKVSLGPEAPGKDVCAKFEDAFEVTGVTTYASRGTPFYSDGSVNCDCYYSSGGGGYFTS